MKKTSLLLSSFVVLLLATFTVTSCKKDKSSSASPTPVGKEVKYEITGNYGGAFTVAYADKDGSYETIEVTSLPWTLSLTGESGMVAAGFGVGAVTEKPGVKGQTAEAKIYINGKVERTSNGTANEDGYIITMNPGTYSF
ncbi:MAG: MmpS family transport accessory protein [Bacteroidota bacterium]